MEKQHLARRRFGGPAIHRTAELCFLCPAIHAIYLGHPTIEYFRLTLSGAGQEVIRNELLTTGWRSSTLPEGASEDQQFIELQSFVFSVPQVPWVVDLQFDELLVLRSAFWQGAASPLGPRPIWVVGDGTDPVVRSSLRITSCPAPDRVSLKYSIVGWPR
jgi:hypothetical protein